MKFISWLTVFALASGPIAPALAKDQTARLTGTKRQPSVVQQVEAVYSNLGTFGAAAHSFSTSKTDINYFNQNFKDLKKEKLSKPQINDGSFVFREHGAVNVVQISAEKPWQLKVNGQNWSIDPKAGMIGNMTTLAGLLDTSQASLLDLVIPRAEAASAETVFKTIKYTAGSIYFLGWAGVVVGLAKSAPNDEDAGYMAAIGVMIGWAWPLVAIEGLKEAMGAEMTLAYPIDGECKPDMWVKARTFDGRQQTITVDRKAKPMRLNVVSDASGEGKNTHYQVDEKFNAKGHADLPLAQIMKPLVESCAKGEAGEKEMKAVFAANQQRLATPAAADKAGGEIPSEKELSNIDAN